MIRLQQQTTYDLMLSLSARECRDLQNRIDALANGALVEPAQVEIHATSLKVRSPRIVDLAIRRASNDRLTLEGKLLIWHMEPETADDISTKVAMALNRGYFSPSELSLVEVGRGRWLQLYAELTVEERA